jgi:gliding motility-associated-like protein
VNKSFFIALILLLGIVAKTEAQQNLVYNGDFEIYDTCPTGYSQPGDPQINHCLGWTMPTYATSDYFNVCNIIPVGVPSNTLGYQFPYNGNGYCGFYAFATIPDSIAGYYWWEYVQGNLSEPLEAGKTYSCSFYVSNAYTFLFAVSELGAYFSTNSISSTNSLPLVPFNPQIKSPTGVYLTDSAGWTKIEGEFVAQGGEQFITIGWFKDTLSTDYIALDPNYIDIGAYYYVDAVSLSEVKSKLDVQNVFSPNGDGINDAFFPTAEYLLSYTCQIYNRWGEKITELNNTNEFWDGTANGKPCSEGVYYYTIYAVGNDDKVYDLKGFVQLLR